jgi:transcriptional regulator with XRE-family HTH domain
MSSHRVGKDDLPQLLLQCRADRNLTLEDVAKALGMSKKSLSDIELGRQKPSRKNRLKLEQFLRKHGYFSKAA